MPDQLHCLNCGHNWFPRYRTSEGLRRCPNCRKQGEYEVLRWYQQYQFSKSPRFPAGSEKTGCGCFLVIILFLIALIQIIASVF